MITNKFVGAIAAAAVIAFAAIPVTANAHSHKHTCYCSEDMMKTKDCKGDHTKHKMTHKACEAMGGMIKKEEATKDEVKK